MLESDKAIEPRSLDRSVFGICFRRFYWWCHIAPVRTGLVLLGLFVLTVQLIPEQPTETLRVRLTAYWSIGKGTDQWTARGISATGVALQENTSVAVDPKVIPYGSRVVWPEGHKLWTAVDTGSAVKDRRAAKAWGEDVPVVDVFFENREDALAWVETIPKFVTVQIFPPEEGWKVDAENL
ncbi:MAG: 3D domain-containing protein [Gammaproteobacteria bacterium]|nr:3D domain-containing protein [Gammaproteobacteria bacterium]